MLVERAAPDVAEEASAALHVGANVLDVLVGKMLRAAEEKPVNMLHVTRVELLVADHLDVVPRVAKV